MRAYRAGEFQVVACELELRHGVHVLHMELHARPLWALAEPHEAVLAAGSGSSFPSYLLIVYIVPSSPSTLAAFCTLAPGLATRSLFSSTGGSTAGTP